MDATFRFLLGKGSEEWSRSVQFFSDTEIHFCFHYTCSKEAPSNPSWGCAQIHRVSPFLRTCPNSTFGGPVHVRTLRLLAHILSSVLRPQEPTPTTEPQVGQEPYGVHSARIFSRSCAVAGPLGLDVANLRWRPGSLVRAEGITVEKKHGFGDGVAPWMTMAFAIYIYS